MFSIKAMASAAANLLRLLQLPAPVQDMVYAGTLDMGHARALLPLDVTRQLALANLIAARGMSVRQTEEMVRQASADGAAGARMRKNSAPARSRDLERFEESAAERLGTNVEIVPGKKGGKLVIHYASNDHLGDLLEMIRQ